MPKKLALLILLLLMRLPLSAEDFSISSGAQTALYSPISLSAGGNIAVTYGNGTSMGIKTSWLFDQKSQLNIFILDFLFRWYFGGSAANSGLFFQFAGGPAIFFEREEDVALPVRIGALTAGLTIGWRFLWGEYFYLEPSISGGYPYIAGTGLSVGIRF